MALCVFAGAVVVVAAGDGVGLYCLIKWLAWPGWRIEGTIHAPLCAASTLNIEGQSRVTLSLRYENLRAACGPRQGERSAGSLPPFVAVIHCPPSLCCGTEFEARLPRSLGRRPR